MGEKVGDKFVIVASDGVWEFISSEEACEMVASHDDATDACVQLVHTAEQKWREEEGSYRDDITCIVAFLPFLDPTRGSEEEMLDSGIASIDLDINPSGEAFEPASPEHKGSWWGKTTDANEDDEGSNFVRRRLSVANPLGEEEQLSLGA